MHKIIVAYVPVIHQGYINFFKSNSDAERIYIFGADIIEKFDYLAKEIRAVNPEQLKDALIAIGFKNIEVLDMASISLLNDPNYQIVLPDEDVSRDLANAALHKATIKFDNVFLRWDKHKATQNLSVDADQTISINDFDRKIINLTRDVSNKSTDWWRHVGAALVKNNKVVMLSFNHHLPSPHTPYTFGDPRNLFHRGVHIELSSAIHAEADLIAKAAKEGIKLEGDAIYVSTFPCPPCAKLIAVSGIKKLFYTGGYGVLDGEQVLKAHNVEIIFVDLGEE